ncbi:MAG TPA: ferritin-like domain-containing protein [Firmicutes bacterium]|nr:ferritin-like domain-containing protein [Bacillota bacterium]
MPILARDRRACNARCRSSVETKALIVRLNWFYSLEAQQVRLYTEQSKAAPDMYSRKVLERVAAIEQGHVDNIGATITRLGGAPTLMGEVLASALGMVVGKASGAAGLIELLKLDISLEEKAMRDYKDLILKVGHDRDLFETLWSNLIDEDIHTAWFANKLKELERIERRRAYLSEVQTPRE